jgi:hypothetical protein
MYVGSWWEGVGSRPQHRWCWAYRHQQPQSRYMSISIHSPSVNCIYLGHYIYVVTQQLYFVYLCMHRRCRDIRSRYCQHKHVVRETWWHHQEEENTGRSLRFKTTFGNPNLKELILVFQRIVFNSQSICSNGLFLVLNQSHDLQCMSYLV